MIYLVRTRDSDGRARYLKKDGTWTEYWREAEEFLRSEARKTAKQYQGASVVEKFADSTRYERMTIEQRIKERN